MSDQQNELKEIRKQVCDIFANTLMEMILNGYFSPRKKPVPIVDEGAMTEKRRYKVNLNLGTHE